MGDFVTITIKEDVINELMFILERECEKSRNFEEIEHLLGVINTLKEEKYLYFEELHKKMQKS